jgi:anti-anti-sigma regulatory factor
VTEDLDAAQACDRPAVVTLPARIDTAASRRLCGQLGSALASAATVIADMTATTFCDSSGVHLLVLAQEQAAAGAGGLLPVYPSLADALATDGRAAERDSGRDPG